MALAQGHGAGRDAICMTAMRLAYATIALPLTGSMAAEGAKGTSVAGGVIASAPPNAPPFGPRTLASTGVCAGWPPGSLLASASATPDR
jgi:hypothetical protein